MSTGMRVFLLKVTKCDAYIFMADRWKPENPIEGKYILLPLKIKDDKLVELEWKEKWNLSIFYN